MATSITKTTGVDNFDSEEVGYVEVWKGNKKAFIQHRSLEVFNRDNLPLNLDAMALAVTIADERIPRHNHVPMDMKQAKHYLKTGEKPIQNKMIKELLNK